MAFFGGQTKTTTSQTVPEPEDRTEDLPQLPEPRTSTIIAQDIVVTGSIHGEGVVQIEGVVEGEVSLQGYVIVAATGVVKGPIQGDVIRVAGSVEGNIVAQDHLRLEKTGTIEGDVKTVSFVVEDGGHLNGRTTMVKGRDSAAKVLLDEAEALKASRNSEDED